MKRRDTLQKCAALGVTVGAGLLVGLSDGDDSEKDAESGPLAVSKVDYREADTGNFVAVISVSNSGKAEATGTLSVTVTAAKPTTASGTGTETEASTVSGASKTSETNETNETATGDDDTVTASESTEVTVPAGETKTVSVPFEFAFSQFERGGSLEANVLSE